MWYPYHMRILLLLCTAALFSAPAKADKFWLSDPDKQAVHGGAPDVIEGEDGFNLASAGADLTARLAAEWIRRMREERRHMRLQRHGLGVLRQ